ncbi:MAG: hypothetical protein J5737_04395 [Bacteroidales bacterium]|nr:hypothetical protein [Bacteroidales bacterium]
MFKRFASFTFAALLISVQLAGQAKIKDVVTSNYNRNSVSFITIQRGDSYDSYTTKAVESFNPGAKFDINDIRTRTFRIRKARKDAVTNSEVQEAVEATPYAREILSSVFNRDSRGMMDDKTVRYRGNYDAKDQDVINARASRVGEDALGDMGYALLKGCYIILTDFYNIDSRTDKEGKVTWSTNARAYAYRLGVDDAAINDFFEQCWIYEDDDTATRDAKLRAFQNLAIPMDYVAYATSSGSGKDVQTAAHSCLSGLVTGLENAIPAWEVAVGISAVKPLRAKIGTKEGLTNGARYRSYSYTEDANGNLKSVPRGFLRATEIASNTGMSIGETEPSEFYQISGLANIEEGWTIKQSNDVGVGLMLSGAFGGLFSSFHISADYLMKVKTNGQMSYILLDATGDFSQNNVSSLYLALGYGYAFHLSRLIEFMPYAMIGDDYMSPSGSGSSITFSEFFKRSGFVIEPGLRLAVNVAYPLQAFGKVYYDFLLANSALNSSYVYYNNYRHHGGLGFQAGLKWTF